MKHYLSKAALAAGLASVLTGVNAAGPVNEAQWSGHYIRMGYHDSISGCVFAGLGASNSWNAAGSSFSILADVFYSHPRVGDQTQDFNYKNITVEDAGTLENPNSLMETRVLRTTGGGTILNADVYVLRSRLDPAFVGGKFYCLSSDDVPSDQVDFESALLHEIGHALGFQLTSEYAGTRSCAMFYGLAAGEKRRILCAAEKQEYISAYGAALEAR